MRILIVSSGSGGHVFPALALGDNLKKQNNLEILFLQTGKENIDKLIVERGFNLVLSNFKHISFDSVIKSTISVFKLFFIMICSLGVVFRVRPNIVVGFGGYHSGPIVLVAHFFGIPTLIHEQNVIPGRTNYILSKFVDKIAISFQETRKYFKSNRVVLTGCPLRSDIIEVTAEESRARYNFSKDKFTILVMGGSQGSHNINLKFLDAVSEIKNRAELQIIHITGSQDYELVNREYSRLKVKSLVFAFLNKIGYAYKLADLIITRAGASTISEIIFLRIPAIIIPYPFARKHQLANAKFLSEAKAAILLEEEKLSAKILREQILTLMLDRKKLTQMRQGFDKMNMTNAVVNLTNEILSLKNDK
jgi:UDP-N-acetylglucosamine--N-acetylmuramyl-(pentapeptide) pyrophosphoryl-undecaprenol N-acetylglucosamine transferase